MASSKPLLPTCSSCRRQLQLRRSQALSSVLAVMYFLSSVEVSVVSWNTQSQLRLQDTRNVTVWRPQSVTGIELAGIQKQKRMAKKGRDFMKKGLLL
jgi:hypothetical protein